MPSTHTSLHYHVVFCTKNRVALLPVAERESIHAYLGGIVRGLGVKAHAVGGMGDHVHVLMGLKATHTLAHVMRELKADSSKWIKEKIAVRQFAWQEGYGAFTVSAQDLKSVSAYIMNQALHHRKRTFQEEYEEMLKRGFVEFDDRYLW